MAFPVRPRAMNLPTVSYEYLDPEGDSQGRHHARCKCKWDISATDPLSVRRAVNTHVNGHLSRMIFDPEPDADN